MIKRLASIPKDKLLHSFYGTLLYALLSVISPVFALWCVISAAIAREVWNESGFDLLDIGATVTVATLLYIGVII